MGPIIQVGRRHAPGAAQQPGDPMLRRSQKPYLCLQDGEVKLLLAAVIRQVRRVLPQALVHPPLACAQQLLFWLLVGICFMFVKFFWTAVEALGPGL
jgi:hypothetical protein